MRGSHDNFKVAVIAIFVICAIGTICDLLYKSSYLVNNDNKSTYVEVVINNVNMQQNISDGNSETVCMVYTNKGTFMIEQEGIIARPNLISKVHSGDTVLIKYIPYDVPMLGMYNIIIDIIEVK